MMPLFKFGTLFIRTLSKPVANAIKKRAVGHPSFRDRCASFAQWWHRMEVSLQVQLMGHTARTIKPLGEAEAVAQGADILGEGVIFSIAALLLAIENRRAAASDARKKAQIRQLALPTPAQTTFRARCGVAAAVVHGVSRVFRCMLRMNARPSSVGAGFAKAFAARVRWS